jgi:hypothetical protein
VAINKQKRFLSWLVKTISADLPGAKLSFHFLPQRKASSMAGCSVVSAWMGLFTYEKIMMSSAKSMVLVFGR